jgi:hypothetical protein
MGRVIELRKPKIRVPTPWLWREGNIGGSDKRERKPDPASSESPARFETNMRNNMHENREVSAVSRRIGDRSGKAIAARRTCTPLSTSDCAVVPMKLPNKEGFRLGGGGGGKSADQGERCGTPHEPDTERGSPCPRGSVACAK